jgi:hypothetical protein
MHLVTFRLWVGYNLASSKPFSRKTPKIIKPLTTSSVRSIKLSQEKRDGDGLVFSKLGSVIDDRVNFPTLRAAG